MRNEKYQNVSKMGSISSLRVEIPDLLHHLAKSPRLKFQNFQIFLHLVKFAAKC